MDLAHSTYLIGVLIFGLIWLTLFIIRPDLRRAMLVMGLILGALGVISGWLWFTHDWWHPLTITNTRIGFEDFLLGFTNGGIAIAIYETIFRRHLIRRPGRTHTLGFIILWTICLGTIGACFWVFGLTSFWSFLIAALIIAISEILLRPDLFFQAVINGLLMMIITLPFYYTMMTIMPNWVDRTYHLDHLTRILIAGIPLEEFVFYFFIGFTIAPGYEYWQNSRLASQPS